jgi:hypothetical protein
MQVVIPLSITNSKELVAIELQGELSSSLGTLQGQSLGTFKFSGEGKVSVAMFNYREQFKCSMHSPDLYYQF